MSDDAVVVGRHAVKALLKDRPEQVRQLLLAADDSKNELAELARNQGIKTHRVSREKLQALAQGANHQGVAAILAAGEYSSLDDIINNAKSAGQQALVLVIDHIEDPHNLGAIIRTAVAVGAQGLVIAKDRACQLSPAVSKAAAGTLHLLPICRVVNLSQALDRLQEEAGLWSVAATMGSHPAPWQQDLRRPLALIIGNEHKGVGQRLLKNSDMLVSLPLSNEVESLNASVAAGVLLYEIQRQRMCA